MYLFITMIKQIKSISMNFSYKLQKSKATHLKTFFFSLNQNNFSLFKNYYFELFIIIFVIGIVIFFIPFLRTPALQLPFEIEEIASAKGILIADGRQVSTNKYNRGKNKQNRFICTVKLLEVTSKSRITASALGIVRLMGEGEEIFKGATVLVTGVNFPMEEENSVYPKHLYFDSAPFINAKTISLVSYPPIADFRRRVLMHLFSALKLIDSSDALATALLTGNRNNLDKTLSDNIRMSGCSHLLALSGMHLGILTMFVFFVFKRAVGVRNSLIAALIFNFLFALAAGMGAALLRAFVFFSLGVFARLINRKRDMRKLLALCFAITVFISPDDAGELSFQYSYIAITGIIFLCEYIYVKLKGWIPPVFSAPLACGFAAQLPTWILSAYVFEEIYFSGIIASLILTPIVTIYMLIAFPAMIFALMGFIPTVFFSLIKTVLEFLSFLIHLLSSFFGSFPSYETGNFSITLLIFLNIFVIFFAVFPISPKKGKIGKILRLFAIYR